MNLYPLNWITEFKGAIRARTKEALKITGGMTFDIFWEFREPIMGRNFLVIDVYARIPVNDYVVNPFIKNIEWAKTSFRGKPPYYLKDKTYGMIVFRNATRRAIELANKHKIRFIRLSDIKVDYDNLRKKVESSNGTLVLASQQIESTIKKSSSKMILPFPHLPMILYRCPSLFNCKSFAAILLSDWSP